MPNTPNTSTTARPHVPDNPTRNALLTGNSAFAAGNHLARPIRRDRGAFAVMPLLFLHCG